MLNLILSYTLSLLVLMYVGNSLLKKRYRCMLVQVIIFIFCVLIFSFVLLISGIEISLYGTYSIIVTYLAYLFCAYKGQVIKKIIIFIIFMVDDSISEVLSTIILNLISFLNTTSSIDSFHYTIAILLSSVFLFSLVSIFIKLIKISNWEVVPKYVYIIFILPISSFLLMFSLRNYLYFFKNDYMFIIVLLGLIVSNYITVYLFLKIINGIELTKALEKAQSEKKLLDLKYDIINTQFNASFYFIHDLIREFMKAEKYLDNNDYEAFKTEMMKINGKMLKEFNMISSNSAVISPLLNYRRNDFIENNIEFKSVIEYNDFSFLDIYTQRSLFNILLNLSISQCNNGPDKEKLILLKTKKFQNSIAIQVLFTHNQCSKELSSSLVELEHLLDGYDSKISFSELYDQKTDSLIIIIPRE